MRRDLVEPAFHSCPPYDYTLGPQVSKLASAAGFAPDPEQDLLLDDIFGRKDDRVAAFEGAVVAPRQNLKTGLFKQVALGWLFVTHEPLIIWSAHVFKTTMEAYLDMVALIVTNPWLSKRVAAMPKGNGNVAIELHPTKRNPKGQRLLFEARTGLGGRGLSAPKMILDEAFALTAGHMGTLMPLMSTFGPRAQLLYGSSAGRPESAVLRGLRDRGRPGGDPSLLYAEWCDDLPGECATEDCTHAVGTPGCRLDDVARRKRANAQAGRRISFSYLDNERRSLPPKEYARERLGWWDDPADSVQVNDPQKWEACRDPQSTIVDTPKFILDVSPLSDWACILAAGKNSVGDTHLEVTSSEVDGHLQMDYRPGVSWVVDRLWSMSRRHEDFVVHVVSGSAAEALVPSLERAHVEVMVHPLAEHKQACVHFHSLLDSAGLAHLGQQELTGAVLAGAKSAVADGLWSWRRAKSSADICPLNAASLGAWLAQDDDYAIEDSVG